MSWMSNICKIEWENGMRNRKFEMGSQKLEMRILNAHIPFPISKFMAFEEKN